MLPFYEIFTLICLCIAGLTGLLAFSSLRDPEKHYSFIDMVRTKGPLYQNTHLIKFLVYFALVISTFCAFLAAFLRVTWFREVGWDTTGVNWAYWWLTLHASNGFAFSALHLIVYFRQKRLYGDLDE